MIRRLIESYFSYTTTREAKTGNWKIAIIYRTIQIFLLLYIFGWDLLYQKSYQFVEKGSSTVTTKVKGIGYLQHGPLNSDKFKIFDTSNSVIPPNEYSSIFVLTNYIETLQSESKCEEDDSKNPAICKMDRDCMNKTLLNLWNGVPTGNCIKSSLNPEMRVCEIFAWCPVERDENKTLFNPIQNVLNYTIFIRNDINFLAFSEKKSNLPPNVTSHFIQTCSNEQVRNPLCPVFSIDQILTSAEPDEHEREMMLEKGGIILVRIKWDCDFDFMSRPCVPSYSFLRYDYPFSSRSTISGFNFRTSNYYHINNTEYRKQIKAFGLRFIIQVDARAGKFNFIPMLVSLGSGIGLLVIPVVIADCLLLNFTDNKDFYKHLKMHTIRISNGSSSAGDGLIRRNSRPHRAHFREFKRNSYEMSMNITRV